MDQCENCGASIGKLETPFVWREHILCGACYGKFNTSQAVQPDALEAIAQAQQQSRHPLGYLPPPQPTYYVQPPRKDRSLLWAGLVLMVCSIPLICIIGPLAAFVFIAGFVLLIVGAFK